MMQNIYDRDAFFSAYQAMRDSRSGINEAVEQPALWSLLPPLDGVRTADLGCGDGLLCRQLVEAGAIRAVGIDPSARMLALAAERTSDPRISYVQAFAEAFEMRSGSVDLVVSCIMSPTWRRSWSRSVPGCARVVGWSPRWNIPS